MAVISNDTATKMVEYEKIIHTQKTYEVLPDSGNTKAFLVDVLLWCITINEIEAEQQRTVEKWLLETVTPKLRDIMTLVEKVDNISSEITLKNDNDDSCSVMIDKEFREDMIYGVIGYGQLSKPKNSF